jgi:hypothetical protein
LLVNGWLPLRTGRSFVGAGRQKNDPLLTFAQNAGTAGKQLKQVI